MSKSKNITLWILQVVLALLFIFTGTIKLVLPIDVLMAQTPLPGLAIRLIGFLELVGAFGLILPGIFRMNKGLISRAALGLIILMIAATICTVITMGWILAILPIVVGILLIPVACGRWPTDTSPSMNKAVWIVFVILTVIAVLVSFFGLQSNQVATPVVTISTTISASSTPAIALPGGHCGGNMTTAPSCSAGYHCAPVPGSHLPFGDVGGTCVKD